VSDSGLAHIREYITYSDNATYTIEVEVIADFCA